MIRIVKLSFDPARSADFEAIFEARRHAIRHFPGCHHLELWKDKMHPGVYFTYSTWEDTAALDAYRHSPLFTEVWASIKGWFAGKPEAWSLDRKA